MIILGASTALIGILLFHTSLFLTLRANSNVRVPFYRSPEFSPAGSVLMRAFGAGLFVFGATLLGTIAWHWALIVVLAGPGAALTAIIIHNRRLTAQIDTLP